jgi:hypothetical protein
MTTVKSCPTMILTLAATLVGVLAGAWPTPAIAAEPAATAVARFDPAKYSQVVTECDRLASHPEDPHRVAPGREKPEIDLPKAIEICRAAVQADPKNPRLNYLYGRVLGYSGRGAEGSRTARPPSTPTIRRRCS